MNPFVGPLEAQADAWRAAADFVEKGADAPERLETMAEVEVGQTPSQVVYRENKLELHHYEPLTDDQYDVPVLVVYALINRPYILDLQPDRSVVRRLLEAGFDVYLIDWGEPSKLDRSLTLEDYVDRYIDNCVDVVCDRAGVDAITLFGYCMGGTMAGMYAALHPDKVRNLAMMAASLYFDDTGGVLELWGDDDYYDPETVAETFGTVPAEFFDIGFALMDPIENTVTKYARLYDNLDDDDFVENFARMETWLGDGIAMAGETYRQYLEDIYQDNKFYRNQLELGDKHVDITNLDMPVLQILAEYDHLVPPDASRPFNDAIPSDDKTILEASTGHIGLSVSSRAHDDLWPRVCDWLAERSTIETESESESESEDETETAPQEEKEEADLETIDGIGPAYADRLADAGIRTIDDLAAADPTALADDIDVAADRVRDWIDQATQIANEN